MLYRAGLSLILIAACVLCLSLVTSSRAGEPAGGPGPTPAALPLEP